MLFVTTVPARNALACEAGGGTKTLAVSDFYFGLCFFAKVLVFGILGTIATIIVATIPAKYN